MTSRDICDNLNTFFLQLGNEPTIGLYYVQEHIKVTLPQYVEIETE